MASDQGSIDPWNEPYSGDHLSETLGPAYTFNVDTRRKFTMMPYNELWPHYFQAIKAELVADLADGNVTYLSIEHVGSTSVPGLTSKATTDLSSNTHHKAVIDVCIVVRKDEFTLDTLRQFEEALFWGTRQGGYQYIGDGGVEDRWSFKVNGVVPPRNLYVVAEGSIPLRAYISLRETLRIDAGLRQEYDEKKRQLAELCFDNVMQYCHLKRPVLRKIFLKGGWTNEEVDEAEKRTKRDWPAPTPADFYEEYDQLFMEGHKAESEASVATSPSLGH
ncbi:MAG: hypothetical protein Q9163_004964 [Psora crenata]